MKKIFQHAAVLLAAMFTLTSCFGDDDDSDVKYDDAAVILSFSLTAANRYVKTTDDDGTVKTVKKSVNVSDYLFNIDQENGLIYNPDSLPYGTDAEHILANLTARTTVGVDAEDDKKKYFNATDSIDFRTERTFTVYSASGKYSRDYKVKVNVHKEEPNVMNWSLLYTNKNFAAIEDMHAAISDGKVYVWGTKDDKTVCYSTSVDGNGKTWKSDTQPEQDAFDPEAASVQNESERDLLPTQDVAVLKLPVRTNVDTWQYVMVGNRSLDEYPADAEATVWGRIVEGDEAANDVPWFLYSADETNKYLLPRMEHLQVAVYDDGLLALGGKGIGGAKQDAFKQFYRSVDQGLTWHDGGYFTLPSTSKTAFDASSSSFAMVVDESNHVWIVCGGSGQVWRGRLNRLGWTEKQEVIE